MMISILIGALSYPKLEMIVLREINWSMFSVIGTLFLGFFALQPILREWKLRELQFSGGLQIELTEWATIVLINKTDEPIETIKISQELCSQWKLDDPPKDYEKRIIEGEKLIAHDNITSIWVNNAERSAENRKKFVRLQYKKSLFDALGHLVDNPNKLNWEDKTVKPPFKLLIPPGAQISWPISLGHDLKYGMSGAPFYIFSVNVFYKKIDRKDSKNIKFYFRYSRYFPPEGWVKVSSAF